MNKFLSLGEAAPLFGFRTGPALRKQFERGNLPGDCLVRVGPRGLRVDVDRLSAALRANPAYGSSAPASGMKP